MNDDDLKKLWQEQSLREPDPSAAQLISVMQRQASRLRRIVDARDVRELVACAVVAIVFGYFAAFLHAAQPISRLGDLIVVASTMFIAWKLIYTRRATPTAPPGATTVEALRAELKAVRAQSRLLGSVFWWYLLPGLIGLLVMTWGTLPIHDPVKLLVMIPANIVVTLFFIAVDVFIYRLNQRARAKQLLPLEAQLESLLRAAETGEPLGEAQVAKLRPIALSMAAADQVKPVEFKVAFWQIALFGEIGLLGFWFFLMLGLTMMDAVDGRRESNQQSPEAVAQSVPAETAKRYSILARKLIDLLNTGDYAAVQKLFNAEMSQALPPRKASEFFTNLLARFGNIEDFDGPTGNGYGGMTAFRLHCQRGELTMSLTLDADDQVAGLYFQPAPRPPMSVRSFFLGLFSPLHLVLIVPFFLAGLLYSWLLQKLTERAVGISSLGIHLHKGQNLILWDEIKQIRPIKVLNVSSLSLISESGEKTIMRWTSLERHSELKAAVEGFAPVNHPMRTYLSLLKVDG